MQIKFRFPSKDVFFSSKATSHGSSSQVPEIRGGVLLFPALKRDKQLTRRYTMHVATHSHEHVPHREVAIYQTDTQAHT